MWPKDVAPYHVVVIPTNMDQEEVVSTAERLYGELLERGLEVVLDDRDERAGVKFADAELIGYPLELVIGKRGLEGGTVEVKLRADGGKREIPIEGAADAVPELLTEAP